MPHIDFDLYRSEGVWRVKESEFCLFHLSPEDAENPPLLSVLGLADDRFRKISALLELERSGDKISEGRLKYNYWIHPGLVAEQSGVAASGGFKGQGCAGPRGIDYVVYRDSYENHERRLLHEEVHLLWSFEVGEAPSLLNEGIAIYADDLLWDGEDAFLQKIRDAWRQAMSENPGLLLKLAQNEGFWSLYGKLPVYTLGAALCFFIIRRFGLDRLKQIFLATCWPDPDLAALLERKTGLAPEELEHSVGEMLCTNRFL